MHSNFRSPLAVKTCGTQRFPVNGGTNIYLRATGTDANTSIVPHSTLRPCEESEPGTVGSDNEPAYTAREEKCFLVI